MSEIYQDIPTYENGEWTTTSFESRKDFYNFILDIFKEPGKYNFNETTNKLFVQESTKYNQTGVYCTAPFKSRDFINYWDGEKQKCKKGVIIKDSENTWFLAREYYMWLNFLPIFDKELQRFGFAKIRDAQYHMALYELLAELDYKHVAILKKRQIASSYYHMGKLINQVWFEQGVTLKIGASLKDYINEKGSWKFLDEYAAFLNEHTAWYRPMNPSKVMMWQQKIEVRKGDRKTEVGLKGTIQGMSFEKDPTNGVGGPCLAPGTLVRMYDGTLQTVENIKIGDIVAGFDGKPKRVKTLFHGESLMYRVDQTKGISYTVTADHTLYLWHHDKKDFVKVKAKNFNNFSNYQKTRKLSGVKFEGINSSDAVLPIDPYYLGLYLGDGCKHDFTVLVNTNKDPEIAEYIFNLCNKEKHTLKVKCKNKYRKDYNDTMVELSLGVGNNRKPEVLKQSYRQKLLTLGVNIKHIPQKYLKASQKQRLELLAGLLDTDGYYNSRKNRFEITSHFLKLTYDIVELCILSGLDAHFHIVSQDGLKSTVNAKATTGYRINITGKIDKIPCKVLRKQVSKLGVKNQNRFSKLTVTPLKVGEYFGFECEDHLFILEDGTVTHNCKYFFHEEAGIAPKMDQTYEYMRPAMRSGFMTTGMFIAAGSVGDLDQCLPLKDMILNPVPKDIYPVDTDLIDNKGTVGVSGLFIPEQWSMPPYIDKYGNSLVEEALQALDEQFEKWKKELSPEEYQLRISQHPRNIKEAFDHRTVSVFPTHLLSAQEKRIEEKEYAYEFLDIYADENGKPAVKKSNKQPIKEFPVPKKLEDKTGCLVVWERPVKDPEFAKTYYASVDPVSEGKTNSSESLCSIYVMKAPVEVKKMVGGEIHESYIEQDKIVAAWCGRYDDITKTHQQLELIIEWYNAWTVIENNISLFIQYMISRKKQKYLVPKSQILFLKDLGANTNVFQEYGWKNTGVLFKSHLLSYAIEYTREELDVETKTDGTIVKTKYGIERIPDPMLIKEMREYSDGVNVDRLVSFAALVAFMKIQHSNRGYSTRTIMDEASKNLEKSSNLYKLYNTPFKHLGKRGSSNGQRFNKSPFKNLK